MADILDAAQSNTPAPPAGPTEPPPVPPEPPAPSPDSLIVPPPEAPAPPPPEEPKPEEVKPPEKPKKKSRIGVLLAGLLLLVITLPVLVVFVKQQVEIRSRAAVGCIAIPTNFSGTVALKNTYCNSLQGYHYDSARNCCLPSTQSPCYYCQDSTCRKSTSTSCDASKNQCLGIGSDAPCRITTTTSAGGDGAGCSYLGKSGNCTLSSDCDRRTRDFGSGNGCTGALGCCIPKVPTPATNTTPCYECKNGNCASNLALSPKCNARLNTCNPRAEGECRVATTTTTASPAPTCVSPNTCVPSNAECRDAGGTQVSATCTNTSWKCCNIPAAPLTCVSPNTCVPSNAECRDAGGTQVSKTCPGNWTCCNIPSTPPSTCTQTPYCIFDNYVSQCVGEQLCEVPVGEMGNLDSNCTSGGAQTACCKNPYYCTSNGTCIKNGTCTPTGIPNRNCHADPSCSGPTSPPPQCINIIAYKDGNALSASELATLQPGYTITLAFAPGGAATKVRFRVNAGNWNETTTKNANGQFIWNYTLENAASFTIEAQWFDGSAWH